VRDEHERMKRRREIMDGHQSSHRNPQGVSFFVSLVQVTWKRAPRCPADNRCGGVRSRRDRCNAVQCSAVQCSGGCRRAAEAGGPRGQGVASALMFRTKDGARGHQIRALLSPCGHFTPPTHPSKYRHVYIINFLNLINSITFVLLTNIVQSWTN
jgi:hypothetical protein